MQIQELQTKTNEFLGRLEEFETLLLSLRENAESSCSNLAQVAARKEELYSLCHKIDCLERLIAVVEQDMSKVERQVEVAQDELGISTASLGSLLKTVFARGKSTKEASTNLNANGEFVAVEILDTGKFFRPPEPVPELEVGIEMGELSEDFLNL